MTTPSLSLNVPTAPSTAIMDEEFDALIQEPGQGPGRGHRPNYSVSEPLGPISGYTNYGPGEMSVISQWKEKLANVFRRNGFTGIETRPVEYADNLLKKGGVSKQIYGLSRLQDGSLTRLGLPFDRTVPLAIFIAQHSNEITFPYKRWDIGYAFRGEHATKGRYRAFIQADNDIIDKNLTPLSDAEVLVTTVQGVNALGVENCNVFVNHILIAKSFLVDEGIEEKDFDNALRVIDKLKPDNLDAVITELTEVIPSMTRESAVILLQRMDYRGPLADFQFDRPVSKNALEALEHLRKVERYAISMGVKPGIIQFCPTLVRGLDYYTGIVMETFIPGKERYGSIASGGRYANLVDGFSHKNTGLQGVGVSIGVTRLFDIMKMEDRVDLSHQTTAQVFVGYRTAGEGCLERALEVATALRARGLCVELYSSTPVKIGKELDICNKKGIPFAALVMREDEICLKNLGESSQDAFSSVEELVAAVDKLELSKIGQ